MEKSTQPKRKRKNKKKPTNSNTTKTKITQNIPPATNSKITIPKRPIYSPQVIKIHKNELLGLVLEYTAQGPLPWERICQQISYEYYDKTVEILVGVSLPTLVNEWGYPFFVVDEKCGTLELDRGIFRSVVQRMIMSLLSTNDRLVMNKVQEFLEDHWNTCIWKSVFGYSKLSSFLKTCSGFEVTGDVIKKIKNPEDEEILLALVVDQIIINSTCSLTALEKKITQIMSGRKCQEIVGKSLIDYLKCFPVFTINNNEVGMISTDTLLSSITEYVKQQNTIVTLNAIENFVIQTWTLPLNIISGKPVRSLLSQAQGLSLHNDRVYIAKPRKKPLRNWLFNTEYHGIKPPAPKMNYVCPLGRYPIPKEYLAFFQEEEIEISAFHNNLKNVYQKLVGDVDLSEKSSLGDCKKFLHHMLYIEEVQMLVDMRQYDLYGIKLIPHNEHYRVNVPSLAENRPSVLRGDHVILRPCHMPNQKQVGYIYFVNIDNIIVDFDRRVNALNYGHGFDLRFEFTRTSLKRMHLGIDNTPPWFLPRTASFPNWEGSIGNFKALPLEIILTIFQGLNLSPLVLCSKGLFTLAFTIYTERKKKYPLTIINKNLNKCQKEAVSMILSHPTLPVVVHGPPGTGKTVTLIEVILQLLTKDQPILICTPTNNAADLICTLLLQYPPSICHIRKIFRLNAFQRNPKTLSPAIWGCSSWREGSFVIPDVVELKKFSVVVCTFVSAGQMVGMGLFEHFGVLCVDEAAQVQETEFLIPLPLLQPNATVALFGDHKQLGPIIRSPICKAKKFDISTLERFVGYNVLKTKLNESYRAHPEIMRTYSNLFYDGSLISRCPEDISNLFVGDNLLQNKKIPTLFIHVAGVEQQDQDSPSWYNMAEVEEVIRQIVRIQRTNKVNNTDIGIITPYQKQSQKFTGRFHHEKPFFEGIKVGTTELFQGDERKVIIISAVRSTSKYLVHDSKYRIGFVSNPNRLDVAISRARSLLIIIGNAELLYASDVNWKQLIKRYIDNNTYVGPLNFLRESKHDLGENGEVNNDLNYDSEWKQYE